jgi:hypothetical protein
MAIPVPADYSDVQTDFDPIVGKFRMTLENGEERAVRAETAEKFAKENGGAEHPGTINWTFGDLENLDDPEDDKFANRKIFYNTPLTPKGRGFLFPLLVAFGEDPEELKRPKAQGETINLDPEEHYGKTVIGQLSVDRRDNTQQRIRILPDNTEEAELP